MLPILSFEDFDHLRLIKESIDQHFGIKNFIIAFGLNSLEHICYSLVKLDPSKIIIAFNNDLVDGKTGGAGNTAARNFKKNLETFFSKDQIIIKLPQSNDFGSMTKEQIIQWKNS